MIAKLPVILPLSVSIVTNSASFKTPLFRTGGLIPNLLTSLFASSTWLYFLTGPITLTLSITPSLVLTLTVSTLAN